MKRWCLWVPHSARPPEAKLGHGVMVFVGSPFHHIRPYAGGPPSGGRNVEHLEKVNELHTRLQ
eukprot:15435917-Alexandrium_andersonii.AAC.1